MTTKPPTTTVLDLDDPRQGEAVVLVSFHGAKIAVGRERLVALLEKESAYWSLVAQQAGSPEGVPAGSLPPPVVMGTRKSYDSPRIVDEVVSHAALCARVTKIHRLSAGSKKIRAAHAGFLMEAIDQFDWRLPEYPSAKLGDHLRAFVSWDDVSLELKQKIDDFLARYLPWRDSA